VPRDLAPLVKGGYVPIGRPRQLPKGEVDSSLSPTPEGGGLPRPRPNVKGVANASGVQPDGGHTPVRSPHPGSQASWECTITQKAAFVCTNFVRVGTVSNGDSGLECLQWGHECKAWDLVSKMPCPILQGQWIPPLILKCWQYAPRGAWPVMQWQSLEKVEVPTRESEIQGPPLWVEG
jgi:hypothetical protein